MRTKLFNAPGKFSNVFYLSLCSVLVFSMGLAAWGHAAAAKEIDASADEVMDRFYKQVKDAKEFARNAKGDIIGFVFDVKGLMADVSFKGAKFTKLDMSK